ncbi:basic salivary proline-rich protein 2-like [Suncus etruscus]|uniref:basic salivary proline-rich protein 2-like n=1 Tax=Suncus etruscus TaxID=109475 RepID=UPI002110349E|nr:basic salivary proline-rich protein 2-like [Suncus etruscus]
MSLPSAPAEVRAAEWLDLLLSGLSSNIHKVGPDSLRASDKAPRLADRTGRPTTGRDANSARRDPPPTRRGEARDAVGQEERAPPLGTPPPRGLERRTLRLPVGRAEAEGGAADPRGPNAPSRIAREGFLRRGGATPEALGERHPSVCAEPAGGPAVPPPRQLGQRPPPARTRGRLSPQRGEGGKQRRARGGLSLRGPGRPRGDPADTTAPTTVAHAPATPWDYAGCVRARARGRPPQDGSPTPPSSPKLDRLDPPPSGPRGRTTTKRRAGARVRSVRKAQFDTGKHSAREREATPPTRPRAPDGRPGALQGHHRRPGGSAATARHRAAPLTPPPRRRGSRLKKTTTRGLSAASEGPRPSAKRAGSGRIPHPCAHPRHTRCGEKRGARWQSEKIGPIRHECPSVPRLARLRPGPGERDTTTSISLGGLGGATSHGPRASGEAERKDANPPLRGKERPPRGGGQRTKQPTSRGGRGEEPVSASNPPRHSGPDHWAPDRRTLPPRSESA